MMRVLAALLLYPTSVAGHATLSEPRSRNYIGYEEGSSSDPSKPDKDNCPYCANFKNADLFCGKPTATSVDLYDTDADGKLTKPSTGETYTPQIEATYTDGEVIEVKSLIKAHHKGHFQIRACPIDELSNECFDSNKLTFVEDLLYGAPVDPFYPERGWVAPKTSGQIMANHMKFKLPEGLVGEHIVLQWRYVTGNACNPDGAAEYFTQDKDPSWPDSWPGRWWSDGMRACQEPWTEVGTSGDPEQFWNCADVKIVDATPATVPVSSPASAPSPVSSPASAPSPVSSPASAPSPVSSPVTVPGCTSLRRWSDEQCASNCGSGASKCHKKCQDQCSSSCECNA